MGLQSKDGSAHVLYFKSLFLKKKKNLFIDGANTALRFCKKHRRGLAVSQARCVR
jgi:hypothetical protein